MIIATLTALILLFGGGGSLGALYDLNALDQRVKSEVTDKDRRKAARAIVKTMKDSAKRHQNVIKTTSEELNASLSAFTQDTPGLDEAWSAYRARMAEFHAEAIEQRFALKEHVTRDEWARIFAVTDPDSSGR